MNEINWSDMAYLAGVLGVVALRMYAGWLCIPQTMPRAWRARMQSKAGQGDQKSRARKRAGQQESNARSSGAGHPSYAFFGINQS